MRFGAFANTYLRSLGRSGRAATASLGWEVLCLAKRLADTRGKGSFAACCSWRKVSSCGLQGHERNRCPDLQLLGNWAWVVEAEPLPRC